MNRLIVVYRVRAAADAIATRAAAIAVEQSVEMPLHSIDDHSVLDEIVGRVEDVRGLGGDLHEVRISLSLSTIGGDAGQLLNMLFGNTSIQADTELHDAEIPTTLAAELGGPNAGIAGLRRRCGAERRAMTCSALKPQGLPPERLADLAARMAEGGIDFIKDDHGLADQRFSPLADRVRAITEALRRVGGRACYVPSLTGDLDALREGARIAEGEGLDMVMLAPMISGLSSLQALVREHPRLAFMAHPAMAGAARIAPAFLIGKLLRWIGGDALVFPNYGGRFGYSKDDCRTLAENARMPRRGMRPAVPVPAGGMKVERADEIIDFYGNDTVLLIGGDLLSAGANLAREARRFADRVAAHALMPREALIK